MTDRLSNNPLDYILPLNINKLEGRMMLIPGPKGKNREFLIVYGHHGLLERWWSLAENYAEYGTVTMVDMPGFGGMDSFGKIGMSPNVDSYADYLAALIKLRFKRKKISLVGEGYGFVAITRMLQKYPQLTKKVDLLISESGITHKDDLALSGFKRFLYYYGSIMLAWKPFVLIEKLFLNYPVIKFVKERSQKNTVTKQKISNEEKAALIEFEARLWQVNNLRTHWLTKAELLNIDMCNNRVNLPVIQIMPKNSILLNRDIIKEHMLVVFSGYKCYLMRGSSASGNILADTKEAGAMLPPALRKQLLKTK